MKKLGAVVQNQKMYKSVQKNRETVYDIHYCYFSAYSRFTLQEGTLCPNCWILHQLFKSL